MHVVDVDTGVSQRGRDRGNHPGNVLVAHDEHVARRWQVDGEIVDHHDARIAFEPDERAGDGVVATPHGHQVHVVLCGRRRQVADFDTAFRSDARRVHVRHWFVAHPAEDSLQHRQREDACVVVGELSVVLDLEP